MTEVKATPITTHKKEGLHFSLLGEIHKVLKKAHELSMNGLISTALPTASSPHAVVYACHPVHLGKMSIPFACHLSAGEHCS